MMTRTWDPDTDTLNDKDEVVLRFFRKVKPKAGSKVDVEAVADDEDGEYSDSSNAIKFNRHGSHYDNVVISPELIDTHTPLLVSQNNPSPLSEMTTTTITTRSGDCTAIFARTMLKFSNCTGER